MATRRTLSCLALVFTLAALPWGVDAGGPWAPQGGSAPDRAADTALGDTPVGPELTAASPPAGRALPVFLDAAAAPPPPGDPPPRHERSRPAAGTSRPTPLYLSHCAFLC